MPMKPWVKNPIAAAVLGAIAVGLPASALFAVGQTNAPPTSVIATQAPNAQASTSAPVAAALPDFSSMVEQYGPAVVNITTTGRIKTANGSGGRGNPRADQNPFGPNSPFGEFFRGLPMPDQNQPPARGEGSGFIIDRDGLVLTNAHVVADAGEITVRLTDRREFTAKVLGSDPTSDVALLKIEAKNLPVVKLGDPRSLKPGQWVIAIGAPFGLDNTVTAGIVSAKGRTLPDGSYVPFIQSDVAVNPGNSGGPLFNLKGEVVGINSQIYSRTGGYQGVSFSIPIDVAMQVGRQLQTTGHVSRGKLGVAIQNVDQALAQSFGLENPHGALISNVEKGGPADAAGLKAGDVILALNDNPVGLSSELPVVVASLPPGSTARLQIWRNGSKKNIDVKLGEMNAAALVKTAAQAESGKLGLAVRALTPQEQEQAETKGGLLVEEVTGAAAVAGIEPGDIVLSANGTVVNKVEDLARLIEKGQKHIALLVQRGDTQIFVPVQTG